MDRSALAAALAAGLLAPGGPVDENDNAADDHDAPGVQDPAAESQAA